MFKLLGNALFVSYLFVSGMIIGDIYTLKARAYVLQLEQQNTIEQQKYLKKSKPVNAKPEKNVRLV